MIHLLVTRAFRHPMNLFLADWGRPLRPRLRLVSYEDALGARRLAAGTWIFSDLERLTAGELEAAARLWRALEGRGEGFRLFNHPLRVKRRYELLRCLKDRGINDFDAYRLTEGRRPARYPVFIRGENDHDGPASGLIADEAALERALAAMPAEGRARDGRLAVEFGAEADAMGLFAKYAAFRIGDAVIPNHVLLSRQWVVKGSNRTKGAAADAADHDYVFANPHAAAIGEVFDIAGIDFGRIDYGLVGGRIQVYEINTNPTFPRPGVARGPVKAATKQRVTDLLLDAFAAIDEERRGLAPVRVPRAGRPALREAASWLAHWLISRPALSAIEPWVERRIREMKRASPDRTATGPAGASPSPDPSLQGRGDQQNQPLET